jgi:phosphohistidine phosphatase
MKTLILMRHAKSSFKDKTIKDSKRPLSKRGVRSAVQMAHLIKERELIPQTLLASKAERAKQTAEIVVRETGYSGEVILMDELFMAEADDLIKILRKTPDEIERVMIIGHNPGLESLVPLFTGRVTALPTAGVAYLSFPIEHWEDLKKKTHAELLELWRPKEVDESMLVDPEPDQSIKADKSN